jgi:hypothetical protein
MPGLTSREARMAFAKFGANSWGVAASVTKGAYFQSDGGMTFQPQRVNDEAFGQAFLADGDLGDVTAPDLTLTQRARYGDYSYVFDALAMGSPNAVTISTSTAGQTTSWQHVTDLAPAIDGLGVTVAIDKVYFVDELTSAKVHGFGMQPGDGGVMDKSYKLLGSKTTNISSINTRSTVNGATYPTLENRVFRKHGIFRMNRQSAGALGASDAVAIESFGLEFERPQDAPHVFGQDFVYEPADNGFPTVKVSVSYPRMTTISANSLYQALRDDPQWKADLTFSGSYINSTDQYTEKYQFPALELDEWTASVTGANQVKPSATFTAKLAATSPTGMAFVTPFRQTRIMVNSLGAFAV